VAISIMRLVFVNATLVEHAMTVEKAGTAPSAFAKGAQTLAAIQTSVARFMAGA